MFIGRGESSNPVSVYHRALRSVCQENEHTLDLGGSWSSGVEEVRVTFFGRRSLCWICPLGQIASNNHAIGCCQDTTSYSGSGFRREGAGTDAPGTFGAVLSSDEAYRQN